MSGVCTSCCPRHPARARRNPWHGHSGLPGAALVLAGLSWLAWLDGFDRLGAGTIILLIILTLASYAIDLLSTAVGARRFGASRQAIVGALVGTVVGLFFGLPGVVIGPFLGAVVGGFAERGLLNDATRAGLGAWLGILVGTAAKLALIFAMVGLAAVAFIFG